MAKIHFYDINGEDGELLKAAAKSKLVNHSVEFETAELSPETVDSQAEVISIFVNSHVSVENMKAMPNLRLIACRSTGYDNVDLKAATDRGITVVNVPSYGENTVAEYAFGLILTLVRKFPQAINALQQGQTDHKNLRGFELHGKTLGIIGAGRIGCNVANIAHGFGLNVLAYDTFEDPARAKKYHFSYRPLQNVLANSDIISLHVPNLPQTRHLLNAKHLAMVKPTAILINTSRGEVVDTDALVDALDSGRLAGAGLDVFEGESLVGVHEELNAIRAKHLDKAFLAQGVDLAILTKLPNVVMTNHNAFNTIEAVQNINDTTIDNLVAFLAGQVQNTVGK